MSVSNKEERVRVAVRLRPFSQKEETRKCKRIVEMDGVVTTLINPQDPQDKKSFTFDYSYWSFDGLKLDADGRTVPDMEHPRGKQYCGQERLFNDLGKTMLADAFQGYNSTLFSYGQTGSGKSYSVIGYGANEGVVPLLCHHMFDSIEERITLATDEVQYEVHLSMMEIYNEAVYDLLNPSKNGRGLKIREHPKKGFYADGLKSYLVAGYSDVERLIEQGTLNRTVASTNMNATSSRAHTIVVLSLVQKKVTKDGEVTTHSTINIVDLAGSERVSKAGNSSGERFREGVAINQSLQCLGHCIHALAESSSASSVNGTVKPTNGKNQRIPYRDSVLTKLLMNALGGNSKTIMIASISPADINYEETLSTLRYADRAKRIKTRATVNEDPTEKLVRDLKSENQRIKKELSRGTIDPQWLKTNMNGRPSNPQAIKEAKKKWEDELRAQMAENDREMKEIKSPVIEKLEPVENAVDLIQPEEQPISRSGPHLQNVNMDPLLNGRWMHYLKEGTTYVGKSIETSHIEMIGPGMLANHAELVVKGNKVSLRPMSEDGRILINGVPIVGVTHLNPNDRLVFGSTQLWLFRHPALEAEAGVSDSPMLNYDYFLNEMAAKSGLTIQADASDSRESIKEELVALLPSVEEANGISAELDKRVKFEIALIAPQVLGNIQDKTVHSQVYVKMKNLENGSEYLWTKEKFLNRFDLMKELYRRYQMKNYDDYDDSEDLKITKDNDPFLESPDAVVIIGVVRIFLQPLAYLVDIKDKLPVSDLRGTPIGSMEVFISPCSDEHGQPLDETELIDSPDQMIGRNVYFEFCIANVNSLPPKFKDIYCKYRLYGDKADVKTEMFPYSAHLEINHKRMISFVPATREFVDYLSHGSIVVEVLGKPIIDPRSSDDSGLMDTRQLLRADRRAISRTAELMPSTNGIGPPNGMKPELIAELHLMKDNQVRLQQRLDFIRQLVDRCMLIGQEGIPTGLLDAMLNVNSPEQAKRIVQQLQLEASDGGEWVDWNMIEPAPKEQRSSVCTIS